MNVNLASLIDAYQSAVRDAVNLMYASGIEAPESNTAWACSGVPQVSELLGGVRYFKHGFGCAVHLPSGTVDFDFGEHGEINGFDLSRLQAFAKNRLN